MFHTSRLAVPRLATKTSALLTRSGKAEKSVAPPNPEARTENSTVSGVTERTTAPLQPPIIDSTKEGRTHILPQKVLKELLNSVSAGQQNFLFGSDKDAGDPTVGVLRATGSFFESINTAYEGRMLQEQQVEVENFVAKRRIHYMQRLNEETEEFRREQKEIHDEIQRLEAEKYKNDLNNDVIQFTKARETEYEARLHADVEKYHNALLAYRARAKKSDQLGANGETPLKQLNMNVIEIMQEMEMDDTLRDFGDAAGIGNDLSDQDIRSYVVQRTCFYEKVVQDEVHEFTKRRKSFYEDLLEARAVRHAAKVRADTEKFHSQRQSYYDERLTADGSWMAKCFQEHYNRCFLQSYARRAWIEHRRYQATLEGIKLVTENGEKVPAISNPSDISISTLNAEIPLSTILDMYESENMAEVTRDVFLKAARRVAADYAPYSVDERPSA
ncbi:hypothetical protein, unknown function [Leishmania infantum JPCM5]|uniref:Uncharacterized protein n=2 Tax=Leishmania infantum TaxID=5671 RepID=A4HSM7_LEIIN|nr:hypothetical protein, unknown function [Leishmania infantum JPCM5]CAC9444257.1 hypothetical_protein [Leishmania infantum]CAM65415.1 hypothetical protein, unknown function [Leishmania infantum JPCM5]SUZ39026.1 hypothetical_protein [Leishmania infantum]|eukprot:XP_001463068.1 hypothetical protein, unknown function [Leishmania infantum JPCM5]